VVIQSPFKDYYDFVANQFGGGDPRIVYVRKRLTPQKNNGNKIYESNFEIEIEGGSPLVDLTSWFCGDQQETQTVFLVVAAKLYRMTQPKNGMYRSYFTNVNNYKVQSPEETAEDIKKRRYRWARHSFTYGIEQPFLVDLSRQIQAPVFVVREAHGLWKSLKTCITIAGQCPILQVVGMPTLIPPTRMYQDLAYFVGNTLHNTPEQQPPVEVTNEQKILKAGFDLKQSFRQRVAK
jgi:hypothetical protein